MLERKFIVVLCNEDVKFVRSRLSKVLIKLCWLRSSWFLRVFFFIDLKKVDVVVELVVREVEFNVL